jgi:prepilin-type processing-associated H-X9-DG protein
MQATANRKPEGAFTRLDLIAALVCAVLLLGVVISRLVAAEPAAGREVCQMNLAALGKAFHSWSKDHGGKLPWLVGPQEGGSLNSPVAGNAWVQMTALSNHLESPKMLACPSDKVRPATEWSRRPSSGFWHPDARDNALSYFVGLDMTENSPRALLSGDHNVQVSARAQRCDYAGVRTAASLRAGDDHLRWTEPVHGDPGNVLFYDGSVKGLNSEQLRTAADEARAYHADNHSLWPR